MSNEISFTSGSIVYSDTKDHFENALLRLLNINQKTFEKWINLSNQGTGTIFNKLKYGFQQLYPETNIINDNPSIIGPGPSNEIGYIWHQSLPNNLSHSIIRSQDNSIAWLARNNNNHCFRETTPPIYEEEYFEGDIKGVGYGNYIAQNWRLEKAKRQLNDIVRHAGLNKGEVLDIGSGYGYFRAALSEAGFSHQGIEISEHAIKITKDLYGYDTLSGTLEDHIQNLQNKYDLITLWDVIEHIAEPSSFLKDITSCLKPGGILAIKTPNIDCPEAEIFGSYYHSMKREHLVYFTTQSLINISKEAGLSFHYGKTPSHLLSGFNGVDVKELENVGRGADIIIYLRKLK